MSNFIRDIIDADLKSGKHQTVATRFPPEPNGYLHIGHAKSICLNFGLGRDYKGRTHLRYDDTNPSTEELEYVNSIQEDIKWLGFDWGDDLYYASDYFEKMYWLAEHLIERGLAYVDSASEEELREKRGTISEPGTPTPDRDRTIADNRNLFRQMRDGQFKDGELVLRAKIDLAAKNMLMRDPILYRIRHAHHYRQGDEWCIYPMYDYAHCLEDSFEEITHSICTLEFENNRELYDWVLEATEVNCRPQQIEFARLGLNYTVMSKRRLLELVNGGHVSGWDDPRMPTIAGLRRRGYTPESIRNFCDVIGVAKANSTVDVAQLEWAIREDLNTKAPRVMCVVDPLKVVITNYDGDTDWLDAPYFPHDIGKEGSRQVPFSGEIYIERTDFMEEPVAKFFRLAPGREVRLRYGYFIKCVDVVKDDDGNITELHCTYDPDTKGGKAPDGRKVKGTIHWVSAAESVPIEIRVYDRLFKAETPGAATGNYLDDINPDSLHTFAGRVEPSVKQDDAETRYQFERQGYFCRDSADSSGDALVFNRIVALRDSWAKIAGDTKPKKTSKTESVQQQTPQDKERPDRSPELEQRMAGLQSDHGLSEDDADVLTRDEAVADFFDSALNVHGNAQAIANWVVNDVARELKDRSVSDLAFSGEDVGSLVEMIDDDTISSKIAKEVFEAMVAGEHGGDPAKIVEAKGLTQLTDPAALEPIIQKVIDANPDNVAKYQGGNERLIGFFVGQVMKETGGKANPTLVNELLKKKLNS